MIEDMNAMIQYSREDVLRKDVVPLQEIVVLLTPIYEATFDNDEDPSSAIRGTSVGQHHTRRSPQHQALK